MAYYPTRLLDETSGNAFNPAVRGSLNTIVDTSISYLSPLLIKQLRQPAYTRLIIALMIRPKEVGRWRSWVTRGNRLVNRGMFHRDLEIKYLLPGGSSASVYTTKLANPKYSAFTDSSTRQEQRGSKVGPKVFGPEGNEEERTEEGPPFPWPRARCKG